MKVHTDYFPASPAFAETATGRQALRFDPASL